MLKGTQRDQQQRVTSENQGSRLVQAASVLRGYENRETLVVSEAGGSHFPFLRVFGGTLLSIAALVCITLYQQFTSTISELRNNLNNLNQSRGDLVKNDDFNTAHDLPLGHCQGTGGFHCGHERPEGAVGAHGAATEGG